MKDVKIVIGANYGDEGKGLMTRHFVLDAKAKAMKPIVIFSNGTAQRGHTVDYSADNRHIYHHFGSGTGDKASTYFAKTFLIHPMEYHREYNELIDQGIIPPFSYFDPEAKVITPFDMVVDHATEEWIAIKNGEREFGSCGFGSWCAAEDRIPMGRTAYSIVNFMNMAMVPLLLEEIWKDCLTILTSRNVDLEKTSFAHLLKDRTAIINNFICDLEFFFRHSWIMPFDILFNSGAFDSFIFENGQGLGLDMSIKNEWHTTSNTGIINPYKRRISMPRSRALLNVLNLVDASVEELPIEQQFLNDLKASIELTDSKGERKPSRSYKPSSLHCISTIQGTSCYLKIFLL